MFRNRKIVRNMGRNNNNNSQQQGNKKRKTRLYITNLHKSVNNGELKVCLGLYIYYMYRKYSNNLVN